MWDPAKTVAVINPNAAGGRVGKQWADLSRELRLRLGKIELMLTERAGHATALARDAVRAGATTILSMGGDGTHNEVVNGIMQAEPAPGVVRLGLLPAGTGGDFRRMCLNNADALTAAAALPHAKSTPIDVGSLSFRADDGTEAHRYFINVASFGIGGVVDRFVNSSKKRLGGKATFYIATLRALAAYQPATVRLTLDGRDLGEHTITNIMVCNGRFAGGGMKFAPDARLSDGKFDVVIFQHRSVLSTVAMSKSIYTGAHINNPHVTVHSGAHIRAETTTDAVAYLDIDGEAPGILPAEFNLHHHAIALLDVRPDVV
ncbi:MAG: diacylglycerol kinase family lipid kinase [Myxococcota bacterium]|nr:diacylglycerol kinase family lipid kinase [Myxococcota bacterium]